jgi:hypothetical protein
MLDHLRRPKRGFESVIRAHFSLKKAEISAQLENWCCQLHAAESQLGWDFSHADAVLPGTQDQDQNASNASNASAASPLPAEGTEEKEGSRIHSGSQSQLGRLRALQEEMATLLADL